MLGLRAKSQYTASTSKSSACSSSSRALLGAGRCQLRGTSPPQVEPISLTSLTPVSGSTSRRGDLQQCCSGGRAGIDPGDRVIASLPYLLPLLDSIPFGKFILLQYPFVARALAPLAPLAALYNSFPFAPFVIFLGVYSGIVANQNLPRFVRYNAMQAVLLDILLIIPQAILGGVFKPPTDEFGFQIYISAYNTIFLFVAISVAYGMGSAIVGQQARLPFVAEAADIQVR